MASLALKIDVDTLRGTRLGVPRLLDILKEHQVNATFLLSLGPDHTGRALKRAFRPGFLKKVSRTSVVKHYGIKTLLYGTLLPGPDIGQRARQEMLSIQAAGFELGIHCWDHIDWQDHVGRQGEDWTRAAMDRAWDRFVEIFGTAPATHGAAGWQMNVHALRWEHDRALRFASDGRGSHPFLPVVRGELLNCLQLPTTLPTFDELIGANGVTEATVADAVLAISSLGLDRPQVFTLHAELEGQRLLPQFERLLTGFKAQGYTLMSLGELASEVAVGALPRHEVMEGTLPGRSGTMSMQGPRFLGDFAPS